MKNYFTALLVLISTIGFSQIKSGVYKSNSKNGDVMLKINEDKTYEMSFFYGNYSIVKDTIQFNNDKTKSSSFSLKNNPEAPKSSTLQLNFKDSQLAYYATSIFLGTQETENGIVNYKKLSDFVSMDSVTYEYPKEFTVELEKGNYLYLVDAKDDIATVSKFQISESNNEIVVEYDAYSFSTIKLKGYVDATTGQLAISDGKTPLFFSFDKLDEVKKETNELNLFEVKEEKDWLKNNGFVTESESTYVDSSYAESYKPPYVFKHVVEKNLKDALKVTEKTPTKLLIVAFDLKNKNAKNEFDAFLKTNEESLSSYMYDNYNPEYDKFTYYLATDKDKFLLDKYKIKSDKELLFFNAQGELIYHTTSTLADKQIDFFSPYSSINAELEKNNQYAQLDKVILDKKATVKAINKALQNSLKIASNYQYETDNAVVASPSYDYPPAEVPPTVTEKEAKKETDTVVEAAATEVVESPYDYSLLKDKENLYMLKSTNAQVQEKWLKVIDYYTSKNEYDKDFVTVAKAELTNTGFSNKLFSNNSKLLKDSDFKLLDYVFKNLQQITLQDSLSQSNYDYTYYESNIVTTLYDVFQNNSSLYNNPEKKEIDKVMKYYEQYLKVSNNNFTVLQNYLTALKDSSNQDTFNQKYIDYYESYFNSVINKDSNVIENLDEAYTTNSKGTYDTWESFKSSFANLANDVSWHVVEKTNDKNVVQKAILWSEISIKIAKNVHYYLDTLAQLYYKNGEKARAISTEEKAFEYGKDSEYGEEYKATLEKMKNGSY